MHCSTPEMVCETKIVADDHEPLPAPRKEGAAVPLWPVLPAAAAPPPPLPAAATAASEGERERVCIRTFHPSEQEAVRRIFREGILERIPNTAFRALKDQPCTQLVYGAMAVICFVVTKSFLLTCCLPIFLMGLRYYFSRKVILNYLECALNTDMADIEHYYMKSPDHQLLEREAYMW